MRGRALLLALALAGAVACESDTTSPITIVYNATLLGANERPAAVTTTGSGTFTGTYNSATNVLTYTVTWQNLSSPSNNAHIHGPLLPNSGTAALGVLVDFNDPAAGRTITHGTSGSASGSIDFKVALNATVSGDSLKKLFENNALYVNVHSVNNGGGEILGYITR